jgi:hypothetical protein
MVLDLSGQPVSTPLEIRVQGDAIAVGRAPWREDEIYTF